MASKAALERLRKEFKRLQKEPVENIEAAPCEDNMLEWHYVIRGPKASLYEGGFYWGKIVFPREYPYKPPSIYMITPNGRFKTNTKLCLSMSDFHPETWNPLWSVSSILSGLLSFMLETSPTYGSIETTDENKRELSQQSLTFNLKHQQYNTLFPHYQQARQQAINQLQQQQAEAAAAAATAALIPSSSPQSSSSSSSTGISLSSSSPATAQQAQAQIHRSRSEVFWLTQ